MVRADEVHLDNTEAAVDDLEARWRGTFVPIQVFVLPNTLQPERCPYDARLESERKLQLPLGLFIC